MITGGAGFVGLALAEELAGCRDTQVLLVDNLSRGRRDVAFETLLERPNVSFFDVDLTDAAAVATLPPDCTHVYHLAALIGVKHVMKQPDQVFRVNLLAILNLLEHFKRGEQLRRFLFSSTSEVYAGALKTYGIAIPTPEETPLTLDDLSKPRTSYALSKITGEAIALQYANVHGLPVTNVRYHNVFGPRMGFAHVVPETMIKISQSNHVPVPSPHHTRAFCYIDDAVGATIACAESDQTRGATVNIGNSSEEVSIRDLVETIAEVMGRPIEIEELPETAGSPARRCPDTAHLEAKTGFRPSIDLRQGLQRTWKWYRDRLGDRFE